MRDVPWPPRPRRFSPPPPPPARRALPHGIPLLERGFAVFAALLMGTQGVPMLLGGGSEGATARPVLVHLAFLGLYAVIFVLLLRSPRVFASVLARAPLLVLLAFWPFVSAVWSLDPGASVQRGVALFGTMLFGLYLSWRFSVPQLVRILATAATLSFVISLFLIFVVPSLGRMSTETWVGAWRGLYFHKNNLGLSTALGGVLLVFAIRESRGFPRLMAVGGLALALLILVGARSTTAVLAFVAMLGAALWSANLQKRPAAAWLFTSMVLAMLAVAVLPLLGAAGFRMAMALLGKNAELSGRLPLWQLVLDVSSLRPWLGYGYEAFWTPDAPMVRRIAQSLRYTPFYSHSGTLETLLNGGRVLLLVVGAAYLGLFWRAYLHLRARPREPSAALPLVFCFFFVFTNFSESKILLRNDLAWALFTAFAFTTARSVRLRFPGRSAVAPRLRAPAVPSMRGGAA